MRALYFTLIALLISAAACKKTETSKPDPRLNYIGDYKGISYASIGGMSCCPNKHQSQSDITVKIELGSTDSTLKYNGVELYFMQYSKDYRGISQGTYDIIAVNEDSFYTGYSNGDRCCVYSRNIKAYRVK